jgi:hypothetical protein
MKYTEETRSYNERRYGKPWIARVTFDNDAKANFHFGAWIGDVGAVGLLQLEVNPGDIVAKGKKDNRNPSYSAPKYYIVQTDGTLSAVNKSEAYQHYDATPTLDELYAKKEDLIRQLEYCQMMIDTAEKNGGGPS